MLEKLNNINFNNISNNPNLGIEVGREIQNASWVKNSNQNPIIIHKTL